jgi:flagellar protein FlaG
MDIFSATSKQVETATTPTVATTTTNRAVEPSDTIATVKQDSQNSQEDMEKTLSQTVEDLNKQMELLDTNISFGFNDEINLMYVNVMEKSSGETIRKIPSEEAMKLSAKMKEIVGMIFDKKG